MKVAETRRLKELEDENRQLKHIVAEQALDIRMLKHVAEEAVEALPGSGPQSANFKRSSRCPSEGRATC